MWIVIGTNKRTGEKKVLDSYKYEVDAESMCEMWGWSYSDNTGNYWMSCEEGANNEEG